MCWCKDCKWYYSEHCCNGKSGLVAEPRDKYDSCKYSEKEGEKEMNKAENLRWFNRIMETKMMKHEEEDPTNINYKGLMIWLKDEIDELEYALAWESKENVIKECADVANMAYFIADKVKRRK